MANINVTPGTGKTVCTTTIGSFEYQNVILTDAAGLQAGAAVVGKVAIDQTTPGTTNLVAADVTKIGGSALAKGQTTASGSIPVVLASDQSALPNPIPSVIAPTSGFTRPADTTAYAFGDLVANSTTAGSVVLDTAAVAKANDQAFTILRCRLQKSGTTITNAIFRVHLYSVAAPTFTNGDNGAWLSTLASSSVNIYLGSMDVTVDKAGSDVSVGIGYPTIGSAIMGKPISGTQNIAYALEARAAYTPANGETFKCYFEVA